MMGAVQVQGFGEGAACGRVQRAVKAQCAVTAQCAVELHHGVKVRGSVEVHSTVEEPGAAVSLTVCSFCTGVKQVAVRNKAHLDVDPCSLAKRQEIQTRVSARESLERGSASSGPKVGKQGEGQRWKVENSGEREGELAREGRRGGWA